MGQVASDEKNEETTLLLEETNVINKECEDKIRPYLELAKKYSLIDDEKEMQNQIKKAYQLSNTLGINIKQNVNNIIEPFYIKKVDQYLRCANESALEGDEENMKHFSQTAFHYAMIINLNINNQINNIKCGDTKTFLTNQMNKYLRMAQEAYTMNDKIFYIELARGKAKRLNINIDHIIKLI